MHFLLAFVIFYITLLNVNGALQYDLTAAERAGLSNLGETGSNGVSKLLDMGWVLTNRTWEIEKLKM